MKSARRRLVVESSWKGRGHTGDPKAHGKRGDQQCQKFQGFPAEGEQKAVMPTLKGHWSHQG